MRPSIPDFHAFNMRRNFETLPYPILGTPVFVPKRTLFETCDTAGMYRLSDGSEFRIGNHEYV